MKIDIKKMETLSYEQPILKKYGNMKTFTLGNSGSGGDSFGQNVNNMNNQQANSHDPDEAGSPNDREKFDMAANNNGPND